jgi:hypothetical protein
LLARMQCKKEMRCADDRAVRYSAHHAVKFHTLRKVVVVCRVGSTHCSRNLLWASV